MSEQNYIAVTIGNRTTTALEVQKHDLYSGTWEAEGDFPPVEVPAGKELTAFRASGRPGTAAGTEGYVVYELGDGSGATVKVYWDAPWGSTYNNLKVDSSDSGITVEVEGWSGSGVTEEVTLTVHDDR
ncbi:aegerolysin family protein [Kitasatospora sp. NBC_00458]|uniref:aegerolysin family protein n=1 Tax=Kitasatospora sp. NBC_00458 TaxID=2903568 RepID=UPI002E193AFE